MTEAFVSALHRDRAQSAGVVRLARHQFAFDLRAFLRNRQSQFFTLALPVMFLVIFASVFSGHTVKVAGGRLDTSVFYVPGIMTLGIIAASLRPPKIQLGAPGPLRASVSDLSEE